MGESAGRHPATWPISSAWRGWRWTPSPQPRQPFAASRIGLVQAVEPHPDAAKLRVCTVDVGQGAPLQIICGAANVAAGMRVPVATIGAVSARRLQDQAGQAARRRILRHDLLRVELGLAETSDGILPLPADAPVGADFRAWLALDDTCIEVDLTPDRGDCLSLAGLAREVAVINRVALTAPAIAPVAPTSDDQLRGATRRPQTPARAMPAASSAASIRPP